MGALMGLLDDAIREHLDLKRRRGADPTAVARAEQEALGPVRREVESAAAPTAPDPAAAEPHEHHEHVAPEQQPPAVAEPAPEPEPIQQQLEPEAPLAEHAAPDPRHSDIVHQPTTEFHVEDHHDEDELEAPAPADEDVLEETPDFLQETPEHDRLWFEQRPPRDFDFDG